MPSTGTSTAYGTYIRYSLLIYIFPTEPSLSNHIVEEEGEFIAYKMSRTLVHNPISHEGLVVKKLFVDGKTYTGTKSIFYSAKLFALHIFIVPPHN